MVRPLSLVNICFLIYHVLRRILSTLEETKTDTGARIPLAALQSQKMHLLVWPQPTDISLRCGKPTVILQAFIFRRKARKAVRERKNPQLAKSCQILPNQSWNPQIGYRPRKITCIFKEYRPHSPDSPCPQSPLFHIPGMTCSEITWLQLQDKTSSSPLPSSPPCSLHSRRSGFLAAHKARSHLRMLSSWFLLPAYVLLP